MPNRIIKESINESTALADVSPFAQDLFKRLITYADDYGRFNAGPDMILARLYPRELTSVHLDDIRAAIFELVGEGKIRVYRASATASRWRGDVEFGYLPGWGDHQRIRQAKHKNPDPETEEVNDVYLRRHIPKDLKVDVFTRDQGVCQCCKKDYSLPGIPIDRAMRLLSGVLHFDHIVPVSQGGRATYENLRLACASCNLSRPKKVDAREVLAGVCDSQQVAANFCLNPIQSNPIQSESNPNPVTPRQSSIPSTAELLPAVAKAPAPNTSETEVQSRCRETWANYSAAYAGRYGTDPVRNAKVNTQVKQLVQRIGSEAPDVAGWFVAHPGGFYVQRMHDFGALLADAEKLRTEWATGRVMTSTAAKQSDRRGAMASAVSNLLAECGGNA